MRARRGRRVLNVVLIGTLALYFGVAILAFGPNGAGLGPMNRLFGWDAPVLAIVPLLLLIWAPMFVLRLLPRRPERSFLCGAQGCARSDPQSQLASAGGVGRNAR